MSPLPHHIPHRVSHPPHSHSPHQPPPQYQPPSHTHSPFTLPTSFHFDIRTTAGQRDDRSRLRCSAPSLRRTTPPRSREPEKRYKRVFDKVGGGWYNIEIDENGDPVPAREQEEHREEEERDMASSGKRKTSIDLTLDDDDEPVPKRSRLGESHRRYGDGGFEREARRESGRFSPRRSADASRRDTGAFSSRREQSSIGVMSGAPTGFGRFDTGKPRLSSLLNRSKALAPRETERQAQKKANLSRMAFVQSDSDDDDDDDDKNQSQNSLTARRAQTSPMFVPPTSPSRKTPSGKSSLSQSPAKETAEERRQMQEEAARRLKQSGISFDGVKIEKQDTIVRDAGETIDLTSPVDEFSFADELDILPDIEASVPSTTTSGAVPAATWIANPAVASFMPPKLPAQQSDPPRLRQEQPLRSQTPQEKPQLFTAPREQPLGSQAPREQSQRLKAPHEQPPRFAPQPSKRPSIPESMRRDNPQRISDAARDAHLAAGSSRNTNYRATRTGFEIDHDGIDTTSPPSRRDSNSGISPSRHDSDTIAPPSRNAPVSIRRRAELEAANAAYAETSSFSTASDDERTSSTTPSRVAPDPTYAEKLRNFPKPNLLTQPDEYIAEGARHGILARSITDRLNSAFGLEGEDRYKPGQVRDRAKVLTGIDMAMRDRTKEKSTKKAKKAAKESDTVDDDDDEEDEIPARAPKPKKAKKAERPTTGGKMPAGDWQREYVFGLTGMSSDSDEDDDERTEPQKYEPYKMQSNDKEVVVRMVNRYHLMESVVDLSGLAEDHDEAEVVEELDRVESTRQVYTDLKAADADGLERAMTLAAGVTRSTVGINIKIQLVDGMPMWRVEDGDMVVRVRLVKRQVRDARIEVSKSACRSSGKIWQLKETIKLVWSGRDAVDEGAGTRSEEVPTRDVTGEVQEQVGEDPQVLSSVMDTATIGLEVAGHASGEASSGVREEAEESPDNTLAEHDGLIGGIDDLFGDGDGDGDTEALFDREVANNDGNIEVQAMDGAAQSTGESDTGEHFASTAETGKENTASIDKSGRKLTTRKKALGYFNTLEEANAFAKEQILNKLVLPFPPKDVARNLTRMDVWRLRRIGEINDDHEAAKEAETGLVHEKIRRAIASDFPNGFTPAADEVEEYTIVWKIKVVEKGFNGAVN
ncbi:hypothetical protein BDZ85DRAFT_130034 [Elsinoe ampelina]|uniref:Uncharacterized protein n=1 Tax=Elsinoe ampelina TaxID=302913 RepID=A0A6A6GAA2_9PEZI|nr:hypothetical protein BDZ85DRAFT_130034 [Elsinoe ampelina]